MAMDEEVNRIKVDKIFKVCPNCGYKDGFHSMFERIQDINEFSWRLICPNCHKISDVGLTAHIEA